MIMSMQAKCMQTFQGVRTKTCPRTTGAALTSRIFFFLSFFFFTAYGLDCFKSGGKLFQSALMELSAYCLYECLTPDSFLGNE